MTTGTNWFRDFEWHLGHVIVKKTGVKLSLDRHLLHLVTEWFRFYFAVRRLARSTGQGPAIYTYPDRLRPWYLLWPGLHLIGARFVDDPRKADLAIQFDDSPRSDHPIPLGPRLLWNTRAKDISKTHVGRVFEQVFGYSLAVDPRTHVGPMVEKSEGNGLHDGRIVQGPCEPRPGKAYQRIVENVAADGMMDDLRTCTCNGEPVLVFVKRRPRELRFTNDNADCWLRRVEEVFSAEEIARIREFCRVLGLDWGGLDVLRDVHDGRVYIVDANKTDMGPPIALPLAQKLEAAQMISQALRAVSQSVRRPAEVAGRAIQAGVP